MAKGSSSRSGPAPDPNALRRERDKSEWVTLPADGRKDPAPEWPLTRPTKRELQLWESEWTRPQAVMWEANGQVLEVAVYVRTIKDAEKPTAAVSSRTLLRQQMDALGLTVPGLRSNRWRIGDGGDGGERRAATEQTGATAKERLRVVQGGAS